MNNIPLGKVIYIIIFSSGICREIVHGIKSQAINNTKIWITELPKDKINNKGTQRFTWKARKWEKTWENRSSLYSGYTERNTTLFWVDQSHRTLRVCCCSHGYGAALVITLTHSLLVSIVLTLFIIIIKFALVVLYTYTTFGYLHT